MDDGEDQAMYFEETGGIMGETGGSTRQNLEDGGYSVKY